MIAITPKTMEEYHPGPMICPKCKYQWWMAPPIKCKICNVPLRRLTKQDLNDD